MRREMAATEGKIEPHDLRLILSSEKTDFLITSNGDHVPISELEGRMVGFYFSFNRSTRCQEFTPKLVEFYSKVKESGESFEIVWISLDEEDEPFKEDLATMPWLALPFHDAYSVDKLTKYFSTGRVPVLFVIGSDGRMLHSNVYDLIDELGHRAYPFLAEKFVEAAEVKKAKNEAQTLESLLVMGKFDFVIGKDATKIPVSDLVGKNILLYFSAKRVPPCCSSLTAKLTKAYNDIKSKDDAFEVIFVSHDYDQSSFEDMFSAMPWLTLPFGDQRAKSLCGYLKFCCLPTIVAIGPSGRTETMDARYLIIAYGSDAYPFTEEHINVLEARKEGQLKEMAKGWPERVNCGSHMEHELLLTRERVYCCHGCDDDGHGWAYCCDECGYSLHPRCAFEECKEKGKEHVESNNGKGDEGASTRGMVCEGGVCLL